MESTLLERPVRQHGTFVLPGIASDVPLTLGTLSNAYQLLARFSLAAEQAGFELPGGDFINVESTVKQQFQGWLDKQITPTAHQLLGGQPNIEVNDQQVLFYMQAPSNLEVVRLSPVIEALEAKVPGLGWYVNHVIEQAPGHGMNIYGPSLMGYQAMYYLQEAESDEEFVIARYEEEHGEPPASEDIPKLTEQYRQDHAYFPSDVLAQVGGHCHLLGWSTGLNKVKRLSSRQAMRAVKTATLSKALQQCVQDALDLDRLFRRDKERTFCWDGSDDVEPMGAVCFVAWDEFSLLAEMAEHYEQDLYNGGQAIEWLTRLSVSASASPEELKQMARHVRSYFERWNALGKLLSNFPAVQGEENDES